MPQQAFYMAYHVDQIARFTQAGQRQKSIDYMQCLDHAMQQQLKPWLDCVLQNSQDLIQLKLTLPTANFLSLQGWQAYYQHQYLIAHQYFSEIIDQDDWQQYATDTALGMAKIYTRTGHWQSAQDWCLYYLTLARKNLSHFDIAKGYGALAEIFLRANYPNEALACFQTAYHLMPIGHGQQARQYNFMASVLIRHKEWLRAETLLHTSRQISRNSLRLNQKNQDAHVSFLHSSMRLCYLNIMRYGEYDSILTDDFKVDYMDGVNKKSGLSALPIGMIHMAIGCHSLNQKNTAKVQFELAMQCFTQQVPMEYQWALRLYTMCNEQAAAPRVSGIDQIFALQPYAVPQFDTVMDLTWRKVQLNNQGFAALVKEQLTVQQLADLWKLFFI